MDITPPFVEYARGSGLNVQLIDGPDDLPPGPFGRITMLSVFTHIPRDQRLGYLAAIRERLTGEALIDILPAVEDYGDVGATWSDTEQFGRDLVDTGFTTISTFDWDARSTPHRYYRIS